MNSTTIIMSIKEKC